MQIVGMKVWRSASIHLRLCPGDALSRLKTTNSMWKFVSFFMGSTAFYLCWRMQMTTVNPTLSAYFTFVMAHNSTSAAQNDCLSIIDTTKLNRLVFITQYDEHSCRFDVAEVFIDGNDLARIVIYTGTF